MERIYIAFAIIATLLTSMLIFAINIQSGSAAWSGSVYIRTDGSIDPPDAPIYTTDNVTYVLTDNITSDLIGIDVERSNIVLDGAGYTIQGSMTPYSHGIGCYQSNTTVINVIVNGFWADIDLGGSFNNVTSNTVWEIDILGSSNNVARNSFGYVWIGGSFNNVSDNRITAGSGHIAIWMTGASNNILSRNNITNSEVGIVLYANSNHNNLSSNNIANNRDGIAFYYDCGNNRIYHNNFVNKVRDVVPLGTVNVWDDGYPSGGNYWSNYSGTDNNGDGIGDTPHVIDSLNSDNYPLVDQTTVLVGDVNGDGFVGIDDIFTIALHFGAEIGQPNYLRVCDLNFDGFIGIDDIFTAASHFGEETP
jgi:parallel beta-helix repeat protein